MQKNQNEKQISNFIEVNGIGTVITTKGYCDVFVYGYFKKWNWWFMVHRDIKDPRYITVSEASTGRKLRDELYYSVEDALHFILPFIEEKRYHFSTIVGNTLVRSQCNLIRRNINLQTLAIDTALWV